MTGSQRKGLLSDALAMMLLAGCATTDPELASRDAQDFDRVSQGAETLREDSPPRDNASYWDGDGLSGPAEVRIDLDERRAYFYKGGKLAGISTVFTGRDGYRTAPGTFRITQKQRHHQSNLYGSYVNGDRDAVARDVDVREDPAPPGTKFQVIYEKEGQRLSLYLTEQSLASLSGLDHAERHLESPVRTGACKGSLSPSGARQIGHTFLLETFRQTIS